MKKTLKQMLSEVSEPRGGDEKRFKDQHVIEVIPHPVALETQFKGDIPKQKRLADYVKGEDAYNYDRSYANRNESVINESSSEEMLKRQCYYIIYAAEEILEYMDDVDIEPWFTNKISGVHEKMKGLHAYVEGEKAMKEDDPEDDGIYFSGDPYGSPFGESLEEAFSEGELDLNKGSVKISKEDAKLLNDMFNDLNSKNQKEFKAELMKDVKGFKEILGFAKEAQ